MAMRGGPTLFIPRGSKPLLLNHLPNGPAQWGEAGSCSLKIYGFGKTAQVCLRMTTASKLFVCSRR